MNFTVEPEHTNQTPGGKSHSGGIGGKSIGNVLEELDILI